MTTKEFFEEYNKAQDKAKCAERHIVKKYLSYSQKLDMAERIINASMYSTASGAKTFRPDTPVRYFLFVMAVIETYTDIKFSEYSDGSAAQGQANLDSFDLFESTGATEVFMKAIGADIERLNAVLKMKVDDVTDMERSLVPFLDTKIQAFAMGNNALLEAMREMQERVENNAE